jgi:small conductance mechanosensitive channel
METAPAPARRHFVRAAVALVLVIATMVVGRSSGQLTTRRLTPGLKDTATEVEIAVALGAIVVVIVAGVVAVRAFATGVRRLMENQGNYLHGAPLGLVISGVGYIAIAICVLVLLGRPVGGLLLGGALTGVLVGIAAQQVLANFFAGVVLLLIRPFTIADEVVLKSGPLGGEYVGVVSDMGLFYVRLETQTGPVALPNAGVLAAAVGPGVRAAEELGEEERAEDSP